MGLKDRPQVDTAAENSSLGANALKYHFQEINGFIAREDIPDKGCDFMVEILDRCQATNWRFPIQLKTVQNPVFIEEGKYLSYSFELSRLGYLLDHKPVVGIIIFYVVAEERLYFDYVDKIYFRLNDQYADDHWKMQQTATIHIPTENVLTPSARQQIHAFMVKTFTNHHEMYQERAGEYRLPVFGPSSPKEATQDLIKKAEKDLRLHGKALLRHGEIGLLNHMLNYLPNRKIISDHKLALLAVFTHYNMGLNVDTEYYLSKILSMKNLPEGDRLTALWAKIQNDYKLNKISSKELVQQFNHIRQNIDPNDKQTLLMIDLIIVNHQIMELSPVTPFPVSLLESIEKYTKEIDAIEETSDQKIHLELLNASNYSRLTLWIIDFVSDIVKLRKSAGHALPRTERAKWDQYLTDHTVKFHMIAHSIYEKAKQKNNIYLQGEAHAMISYNTLALVFMQLDSPVGYRQFTEPKYKKKYNEKLMYDIGLAINAIVLFEKGGYLLRAYQCYCIALELFHIADHLGFEIDYDKEALNQSRQRLQAHIQAPDYEFQAFKLIGDIDAKS